MFPVKRFALTILGLIAAAVAVADTYQGAELQAGFSGGFPANGDPCAGWLECDGFDVDTLGTDWDEYGDGWSVSGSSLSNVYVSAQGETFVGRTTPAADSSHCQVMQIASNDTVQAAPGFVMRALSANLSTATRLDMLLAEDTVPHEFVLRSYVSGGSSTIEDSIVHSITAFPAWIGACIDGNIIQVFDFGTAMPSPDPTGWESAYVGVLLHDGSPAVTTSTPEYGLRNWRDSSSGETQIGYWAALNDTYTSPPILALSSNSLSPTSTEGALPSDVAINVLNNGGGSLDWTVSRISIDDCNGVGVGGGTDWVNTDPDLDTGTTSAAPSAVDIQYSDTGCLESESPHIAQFEFVSDPVTTTQTLTVTRNTQTSGGGEPSGSYPPSSYVDTDAYNGTAEEIGYGMPSCLADYGRTAAQIDATPCGNLDGSGNLKPATKYSACSISGCTDLGGDDTVLDCVHWSSGNCSYLFRCEVAGNCDDLTIKRSTLTGSYPNVTYQLFLKFHNYTSSARSGLIQDTIIENSNTFASCGAGVNSDVETYDSPAQDDINPYGSSSYALIFDRTIMRRPYTAASEHTEYFFQQEACKGVEIKNSRWDALAGVAGVDGQGLGSSIIQVQQSSTTNGNLYVHDNYFRSDGNGVQFQFARNSISCTAACGDYAFCSTNNVFQNNIIVDNVNPVFPGVPETWLDTGNCSTCNQNCPGFTSRAGSSCNGNTLNPGEIAFDCTGNNGGNTPGLN